jgi:hypothetical protein
MATESVPKGKRIGGRKVPVDLCDDVSKSDDRFSDKIGK